MTAPAANIQPLRLLSQRFDANVAALASRYPELAVALRKRVPSHDYKLIIVGDALSIGTATAEGVRPLPSTLSAPVAHDAVSRLFPNGFCDRATLIVGEELGWLWNAVYRVPCRVAALPTHRPPLYFLIGDLEKLWRLLHVQDWAALLADPRVILYAGPDAVERFRAGLVTNVYLPWPLASIVVEPNLWPADVSLTDVRNEAQRSANDRLATVNHMQALTRAASITPPFDARRKLRVLGICSRYTTFLRHSMRDWLAGFDRLGHQTQFLIESGDHELANTLAVAEACLDFQPDLVVAIDHCRAEFNVIPTDVPMAMWVQDYMPNIFSAAGGASQTELDYTIGFAGLKLIKEFGYPASRFVPAVVAVDDERFSNRPCPAAELDPLRCEASFVSHASKPGEAMVQAEVDRLQSPAASRLLWGIFEQLKATYIAGGIVTEPGVIEQLIETTMQSTATSLPAEQCKILHSFFYLKVNNALFRHQTLQWLSDAGVNLHLYGNGWEEHPTLGKHARGPAEHGDHLRKIYQASAINLQITPHGALHQRLFEGLSSGGFFLMRRVPGDVLERHLLAIANWCNTTGIETDQRLQNHTPTFVQQHIAAVAESLQLDPFRMPMSLIETARWSETTGCIRSAGSVFNDDYETTAFNSRDELLQKTDLFLKDAVARQQIATRMRAVVVERFTYTATCKRLLDAITADSNGMPRRRAAA